METARRNPATSRVMSRAALPMRFTSLACVFDWICFAAESPPMGRRRLRAPRQMSRLLPLYPGLPAGACGYHHAVRVGRTPTA
jgi:hypothetical protein